MRTAFSTLPTPARTPSAARECYERDNELTGQNMMTMAFRFILITMHSECRQFGFYAMNLMELSAQRGTPIDYARFSTLTGCAAIRHCETLLRKGHTLGSCE